MAIPLFLKNQFDEINYSLVLQSYLCGLISIEFDSEP
jgi:hypothetical protein